MESPWAQLVSTGNEEEVIPIVGETFSIGRTRDLADLVIPDNKHLSGCHCVVLRGGPHVMLRDTSTNGILLNNKRLQKNVEVELTDNDVITLVQKKDSNIVFRFQTLTREDADATLTYEPDATLTYEPGSTVELEDSEVATNLAGGKRKLAEEDYEEGAPRVKLNPALVTAASAGQQGGNGGQPGGNGGPSGGSGGQPGGNGGPSGGSGGQPGGNGGPSGDTVPSLVKMDSIEETLLCQICQEILHDCVSLQPCMHSYCAGCYSQWMSCSSQCPNCRHEVERINKNHIVNNLVAAYLRANPGKSRPAREMEELDAKNKITRDMLYPKKSDSDDDDDDDDDNDDDDYDSMEDFAPTVFHASFSVSAPLLWLCRQCPNHAHPLPASPHTYTCDTSTSHVLCQCCLRPMPDRNSPAIPQKCEVCSQHFCHMYWSCDKPGCLGCIGPFKDLNFYPTCLNGILGNAYESNVLKNYFESKGITIRDFLQLCCRKMDSGEYACPGLQITPTTTCCQDCALMLLKRLAYLYRRDIPSSDLPNEVSRRVDCHWGSECRTQFSKPDHAKRFNHVCERTRAT